MQTTKIILSIHIDELIKTLVGFKNKLPIIVALYVPIVIFFSIVSFLTLIVHFDNYGNVLNANCENIIAFARLSTMIISAKWAIDLANIMFFPFWFVGFYALFLINKALLEIIFRIFYKADYKHVILHKKYQSFLKKKLFKKNIIIILMVTLPILLIRITVLTNINDLTTVQLFEIMGSIALFVGIPVNFITHCVQYFSIFRSRKNKTFFAQFLLSQNAIRRGFKSTIDLLVFLAILSWFLIPAIFNLNTYISAQLSNFYINKMSYTETYEKLKNLENIQYKKNHAYASMPPIAQELEFYLNPLSNFGKGQPYEMALPIIQSYFFLIVSLSGLLSIGLPVISSIILCKGYLTAIKKIAINTIKSTIIIIALQALVKYAYFIDLSDPFGIGFLFSLLLSFFFTQDSDLFSKYGFITNDNLKCGHIVSNKSVK